VPQPPEPFDLLIRAGQVACPLIGTTFHSNVAIRGDRIVALGTDVDGASRRTINVPDAILLPGLIDLHAHPAREGSMFGVDPDLSCLTRGTTTVLSQGDAGALGCADFIRTTIESSQTESFLAINLSVYGEVGPGGCFESPDAIDVSKCVAAIDRYRTSIWGVSVNCSHHCCGRTDPRAVLRQGLEVAELTGLPLLYGMRRPEDWPLEEQLALLRPGDVVTYCFRRTPHCIVSRHQVLECVLDARARGVLFDVGHGRGSFDFTTAETAVGNGFLPDTISTDLQRGHAGTLPVHDLPLVMSKLRAVGMQDVDIFIAVTSNPARVLGRLNEIGTLQVGSRADLVLLRWNDEATLLFDTSGDQRSGGTWCAKATIRAGEVVHRPMPIV